MPLASPRQMALRAEQRAAVLAAITKAGADGLSPVALARDMALPVRIVVNRITELRRDGRIAKGVRNPVDTPFVLPELLAWHRAAEAARRQAAKDALKAEREKAAMAAKRAKDAAKHQAKRAKATAEVLSNFDEPFVHRVVPAAGQPMPVTRAVRSVFEVAA